MATAGRTLKVALVANTKNFRQGMMSAARDAKGFQGKMGAVATSLRGTLGPALMAAAAAAGALAVKLGVDGVKAAIADQKTVAVLAKTLDNLGQAHRQAGVEEFIAGMESATGVADEELRPALGLLLQATGDVDEAQRRMAQAMDIAIGTNNSLDSVVRALSKSLATGASGTLSRYNVMIDQNTVATEGFGAALDEAASGFDGLANEEARTLEGRLRILKTEAANVQEAFGYGIVNSLGGAGDSADDLSARLRELKDDAENLGEAVGNSIGDLLDLAKGILAAKEAVDGFLDSAGILGDVVQGEVGGMVNPVGKATDMVKQLAAALTGNDQAFLEAAGLVPDVAYAASDGIKAFGVTASEVREEIEGLNEELSFLEDYVTRTNAILNYEEAWDDLRKTLKENGKQFDYGTRKGRENNQALIKFAEATAAAADAQETMFGKVAYSQDALTNLGTLFETTKMGPKARAAMLSPFQALIDDLATAGVDVTALQTQINNLKGKDVDVNVNYNYNGTPPPGIPGRAYGGYVDGKGGSRADNIPMMLSAGEFVIQAPAVAKFGRGLFAALNQGVNPLAGMSTSGSASGSGFQIGTINVVAAPGERAETSLPRALRRASFLAGVNG